MKILFVIPSLAGGGQEKAGMILTNYLADYHSVLVVSLEPASPNDFNYKNPVQRIVIERASSTLGKALVVIKRIAALRKIKKQFKPDVSIAFGITAMFVNNLSFGKEQRISSLRFSLSRLHNKGLFTKLLFLLSGKMVPVSNGINEQLLRYFKIKNSLFANNGYDIQKIKSDSKKETEEYLLPFFNGNVVVHMGRFDIQKGNYEIVKFFDLAKKAMPELKLLLLGSVDVSGSLNTTIYNFCVDYLRQNGYQLKAIGEEISGPVENYDVLMLGHQMNPHKYLSRSNLFIFPSLTEGFPNALIESMACGLPVICSDCPISPKEILINEITNEKYGILMPVFSGHFDPLDYNTNDLHQQWADAITGLMSDRLGLAYYKMQSLKRVEDFSQEKSCQKWLQIIENKA